MSYRIWYSTESFADFVIDHTDLRSKSTVKIKMYESDANNARNFHAMPDHIKQILYLDAPDLIVERDTEPIFSVEVSTEAGTGHNAFQRFARLAASVENNVPALYIYPEAAIVTRAGGVAKWDKINPLVFKALDDVMNIYGIPALLYYYPSDFLTHADAATSPKIAQKGLSHDRNIRRYPGCPDSTAPQMQEMFAVIDEMVRMVEKHGVHKAYPKMLANRVIGAQRASMQAAAIAKGVHMAMSPLSAVEVVDTDFLLNHLSQYEDSVYRLGELLRSRAKTVIYKVDAKFRGDPYPGALAAIDYLLCREGKTFEDRRFNLVMAWGDLAIDHTARTFEVRSSKASIDDFVNDVKRSGVKNLLTKDYDELEHYEVPRYYMQARYGSMFSKVKHIRVYSYFADAILFTDGALWRDA